MYTYVSIMNPIYEWWRLSRLSKHSYSTIRTSLVRSWCMLWKVCSDSELVDWQGIKTGLLVSLQRLQQELAEQAKLQSNRTYKSFSLTQLQESKTRFIEAGSGSLSYFFFPEEISQQPLVVIGPKVIGIWERANSYLRFLCSPVSVNWYSYIEIFNPECSQGFRRACGKLLFFVILDCELCKLLGKLSVKCFWMGKLLLSAQFNRGDFFSPVGSFIILQSRKIKLKGL